MKPGIKPTANIQANRRGQCQYILLVICCLLTGIFLSACATGKVKAPASETYEVAPLFREFYNSLGGEEVLGKAISQTFDFNQLECQYTVNALMCQEPLLSADERFRLYPLGTIFKVPDTSEALSGDNGGLEVNGISVFEEFIPFYQQFSAAGFAGNPISPPRINYAQQRVEQYFENIGLYRSFNDAPGKVKLLAYGAFACNEVCNYLPRVEAMILDPSQAATDQPFLPALGAMDSSTMFGVPLTQPYIAKDGSMEQVYTNAILYSPAEDPDKIKLRPLPEVLGIPRQEPVAREHDSKENVVFYPVKDELGYHVPTVFDVFIVNHGGRGFSGDPISETIEINPGLYRQCFTYYCLLFDPALVEEEQVTLAPLGQQYLESLENAASELSPVVISSDTVKLQVNEQYPMLAVGESQRIEILVTKTEDQSALAGVEATLVVQLPDGERYSSDFPVTSKEGLSVLEIPAQKLIPNGTILVYEVCLKSASSLPVCTQGSYLVWKTP